MVPALFLLFFLLILSAFFSGAETAFTSLTAMQIETMSKEKGRRGKEIKSLTSKPEILLTTLLIGNNLVNIGASAMATTLTIELFSNYFVAYTTGILTLLILVFCEVTPKQVALTANEKICLMAVDVILVLSLILRPLIWVIGKFTSTLVSLLSRGEKKSITVENLLYMMKMGENMGIVENYENQMVKNVFRINDTPIKNITTHRKDVFCLSRDIPVIEALPEIIESGFSRIPIYKSSPEDICGIVLFKDLAEALFGKKKENKDFKLKDFSQDPIFIPSSRKVHELFIQFKKEELNIAVVLDEYGGLEGIVTRENVIEEIFGELYDEGEKKEDEKIIHESEDSWIIKGDTNFYDIQDKLGLELEHDKRTMTLGGYLIEKAGYIPEKNTKIKLPEGKYEILHINQFRIGEVRFTPKTAKKEKKNK